MAPSRSPPRTSFFGRREILEEIRGGLERGRLTTLSGVGGAGKTRLARRVVEEWPESASTAFWAELAALADPRLVPATVCAAVGLTPPAGADPAEVAAARLAEGPALLVLDNCEHVGDAAAELVDHLLNRCPELRILATSREPLGVAGERRLPVPPLPVPGVDAGDSVEAVARADAARLLVDRIQAVSPDFRLTTGTAPAVASVCRRLDGIPLALELAAARAGVLSIEEIDEGLRSGLALLRGSDRRAPPRHRTMETAIAWSHDMLSEPERALFRRLGVFAGGATLPACEAVCADAIVPADSILDHITALVDRSLLVVERTDGTSRYRLLEPVAHFARGCLAAAGERDLIADRHRSWFVAAAAAGAASLRGPDRAATRARLEADHNDIRRAWARAEATGDMDTLDDLAGSLFWLWNFGGHFVEGRRRVDAALATIPAGDLAGSSLLWAGGTLAWIQGDVEIARQRLLDAVRVAQDLGTPAAEGPALRELAGVRMTMGDFAGATEAYEAALDIFDPERDAWDRALAQTMLAEVERARGDETGARRLAEEARRAFDRIGEPWGRALAEFSLGVAAGRRGDLAAAREHARRALAVQRGDGDLWNVHQSLVLLGEVEWADADLGLAADHFGEALRIQIRMGDRVSVSHTLLCLSGVEHGRGRNARAARLAGAVAARREPEGGYPFALDGVSASEEWLRAARTALGEADFAAEMAEGAAMDDETVLAYALSATERVTDRLPVVRTEGGVSPSLRIYALGPPVIVRSGRRVERAAWGYALPRELLFYLLVHGPRTKEQIAADFWPEASPHQVRGRFRTALHQLRKALGSRGWVVHRDGRYAFRDGGDHWFDVRAFESSLGKARAVEDADPGAAAGWFEAAFRLYRGDFLIGEEVGPWAGPVRTRLRRERLDAVLRLASLRTTMGADAAATVALRTAVEVDPVHEPAHRALAENLARRGDRAEAAKILDNLSARLLDEVGVEPAPETRALRRRLTSPPSLP